MSEKDLNTVIEDHALEQVPESERQGWLQLSWGTAGIVTTLIQLFFGALVTFVAGIKLGIIAGIFVTIVGGLLGWGVGHIAYRSGLSSTVLARYYGFGTKGSVVASVIFGFMILGFLALENALLYKGFLFYFNLDDTLASRIIIYGILTVVWVLLTTYGFKVVARVSSITLVAFLAVLVYMVFDVITRSGQSWGDVMSFGAQFPPEVLAAMGADTDTGKLIFGINVLIGSAGALALVDADFGRYSRSSKDIGIAAFVGNFFMDVVMFCIGGIVMYAGMGKLIDYYMTVKGMDQAAAAEIALQSPDSIAAAFIIFGGVIGTILMVLAQSKAQVLNTYSGSLALSNLFDVLFHWRPGRFLFVVLANIIGLIMLYGSILELVNAWITVLGVLTTCFAGIIMADYFIVRRKLGHENIKEFGADQVNWAGVLSTVVGFVLAHYVLNQIVPIEFFTSLIVSFAVYPILRLYVFKPKYTKTEDRDWGAAV
ncbi:cytosine permease [Ammoniphilus sp. CFH 90114]|uniref:purine-cytosine permease family protein n=1 Tax=Ammoniphilus sp. CFH 90114 TaxID=2493665 RepID=UPI00100DE825|nr:cytosine permease [Ammoniphilus sp. CFH 90114]RXT08033.1 purine-cytosine permease-like transporter [Ammoniphilus sp. CFH 90114]